MQKVAEEDAASEVLVLLSTSRSIDDTTWSRVYSTVQYISVVKALKNT